MIFGIKDRCSHAYRLWARSLIWFKNHMGGFHRNSSTILP